MSWSTASLSSTVFQPKYCLANTKPNFFPNLLKSSPNVKNYPLRKTFLKAFNLFQVAQVLISTDKDVSELSSKMAAACSSKLENKFRHCSSKSWWGLNNLFGAGIGPTSSGFWNFLVTQLELTDCILFGSVDTCFFVGTNHLVGVDVEVHSSKTSWHCSNAYKISER